MRRNYQPKQKFDSLTRLRQEFYCFLIVAWCVYVVLLNQNPCRVFFANVNTIEFVYGSNRIQKSSISNRGCQDETEFYMKKCTVSKSKVWMERDIDRICIPWNQYRRQFLRNSTIWNRTLDFVKNPTHAYIHGSINHNLRRTELSILIYRVGKDEMHALNFNSQCSQFYFRLK